MIKRFYSTIQNFPINVSSNAWIKIKEILEKSNNKYGFLFYASNGGCNGFNYNLELLDDEIDNSKIKHNFISDKDNNRVYIDPSSEIFLMGTEIDFVNEDYKKNIFESKFIFTPDKNLATTCGCGISFNPKS